MGKKTNELFVKDAHICEKLILSGSFKNQIKAKKSELYNSLAPQTYISNFTSIC